MTTATQFQTKVDKAGVNMDRLDRMVNGGPTEDVIVDDGLAVPSFAKLQGTAAVDVASAHQSALDAAAARDMAVATVAAPRPASLSDAARNHVLIPKNATYFNGGANQVGAVKIGLPVGILERENMIRVLVHDHYGLLIYTFGGRNDGAWNYRTVDVQGQHSIIKDADRIVRFGSDATGPCIWVGEPGYAFWDNLTIKVLDATFDGGPITETWMGDWRVGLTTTIENAYAVVPTYLPVTSQHVNIDVARLAVAIGPGAKTGKRASNYQVVMGALAGSDSPNNFNNVFLGLQCGSESDGTSACTFVGMQAGQHVKDGTNGTGSGIHALLSWQHGVNMTATGAGAMEYAVSVSRCTADGAYAGRDNQANGCGFYGNNAGLYSVNEAGAFHMANNENESLLRGNYDTRYLNVNGALSSEGVKPLADNAFSLGTSSLRYSVVYAGTGAINTSDERMKRDIGAIPGKWLDAWGEVEWARFHFVDGTRWHTGLVAQHVHVAFAKHGLDAFEIGLCCKDEWDEQTEPVTELRDVVKVKQRPKVVDGVMQFTVEKVGELEDGAEVVSPVPVMEDYEETIQQMFETGETRVVREAGELWGLRYDECFAIEAAWQRREIARLQQKLSSRD